MRPEDLAARVATRHPDVLVARGDAQVIVERDRLRDALAWMREDPELAMDLLLNVTATDWPDATPRYWVAYELRSMRHHHRIRVKVGLAADDARIPSVTDLFPTADWHERETFDFYGIDFEGHPDLRRILLPDGWEGHPLRRTEELGGVGTRYRGAFIPTVDERTR